MIFATDLDGTLIHSERHLTENETVKVVEYKNRKPLSFMSAKAAKTFRELKQIPNLKIIPVTARTEEQFRRIEIIQDCHYAILA